MSLSSANSPLGILGGTFDPVHLGHLRLAEEACERLGLGQVLWIPAGQPPHRGTPAAQGEHRLAMVRLATTGNGAFAVDDSEIIAGQPSYTHTTLSRLRALVGPARPLVLLMGADAFHGLTTWHRWQELFALAHLAIATRPGHDLRPEGMPDELATEFCQRTRPMQEGDAAGVILPFPITPLDISATGIRTALAEGRSPRYLLPEAVLDYIFRNQLYAR